MKPTIPITDPRFKYTQSYATDIRKLFERVRHDETIRRCGGNQHTITTTALRVPV